MRGGVFGFKSLFYGEKKHTYTKVTYLDKDKIILPGYSWIPGRKDFQQRDKIYLNMLYLLGSSGHEKKERKRDGNPPDARGGYGKLDDSRPDV